MPAIADRSDFWYLVEKLASLHCTRTEIAACLGKDAQDLLRRKRFITAYKRGWDRGGLGLRRRQFQAMLDGDCSALISLGTQTLNARTTISEMSKVNLSKLSVTDLRRLKQLMRKTSDHQLGVDGVMAETELVEEEQ